MLLEVVFFFFIFLLLVGAGGGFFLCFFLGVTGFSGSIEIFPNMSDIILLRNDA
jgi:hypothetical protein